MERGPGKSCALDTGPDADAERMFAALATYAAELVGPTATVAVTRLSVSIPILTITPNRGGARSVSVVAEQSLVLEVENGACARWELTYSDEDSAFARCVLDAVVAGRVEERAAPARSQLTLTFADGSTHQAEGFNAPAGLVPRRGWRKRAHVLRPLPYA